MEIKMKSIVLILIVLFCIMFQAESQDNPHYTATDPAIREMMSSLEMPRYAGNVPAENIAGDWHLMLDNENYIDLALLQSGSAIFGRGSIASGISSQWATASGSISGSSLLLDVVPESGTELYSISIDIGSLPFAGTFVVFRDDSAPRPGNLQASKILPDVMKMQHDTAKNAIGNIRA
jgi:hypothetical protein